MANTLVTLRNEVHGLETIDTAWDVDIRRWYDAMAAAGMRKTFQETAAFDIVVKAIKTLALSASTGIPTLPVNDATGNTATIPVEAGKSVLMSLMYVDTSGTVGKVDVFVKSDGGTLTNIQNMGMLVSEGLSDLTLTASGNGLTVTPILTTGALPVGSLSIISSQSV